MIPSTTSTADVITERLVELLRSQLGCNAARWSCNETSAFADQCDEQSRQSRIAKTTQDGVILLGCDPDHSLIALRLPTEAIVTWQVSAITAVSSLAHAKTTIELHQTQSSLTQLESEVEALTNQVLHDFEELALIRSLASSMELPTGSVETNELVHRSLVPLATGVSAISIAAVLLDKDDQTMLSPTWSDGEVVPAETLVHLIDEHREEAAMQPVVRNRTNNFDQTIFDERLNEFMLVQCRSEGRLHGWIIACNHSEDVTTDVSWAQIGFTTVQASLLETATSQLAAQLHNLSLLRQKEDLFTEVVRALVNAVEARDPYTCGHSERVASFGRCLASLIGEQATVRERIYLTGLLHDVGKIAIPDGVLQKPGRLDDGERAIIETHTDAGWRILHELDALKDVLPGVLYHHEQFNGQGYPDGLVGENIPLDGRILAVCDAFDAMTSDRPYRKGMPIEKAVEILQGGAGNHWDPRLIEAFVSNIDKIDEIRINHQPRQQSERPAPVDGMPVAFMNGAELV